MVLGFTKAPDSKGFGSKRMAFTVSALLLQHTHQVITEICCLFISLHYLTTSLPHYLTTPLGCHDATGG
jgi:hypothetical protein